MNSVTNTKPMALVRALDRIGIWKCWCLWREEIKSEKQSKVKNQQQIQPTYHARFSYPQDINTRFINMAIMMIN